MTTTTDLLARLTVPQSEPCRRRSILLEGDPGSGKTFAALQAPGPILCVYSDNNRMTLDMMRTRRSDIIEVHIEEWKDFDPQLLNAIRNREIEAETIVVDSGDMLFNILLEEERQIAGGKLEFDNWAKILNIQRRVTSSLTQVCRPQPDKRDYNFIMTVHLQDKTTKDGALVKYEPAIQGSFRTKIESYFDLVLLASFENKRVKVAGSNTMVPKKECFLRTVAPSMFYTCKAPVHWPARLADFNEIQTLIDKDLKGDTK